MGKYLKLFEEHSDYEDFIESEDFILPNVSLCEDQPDVVHFNPYVRDYSKEYFTTEALEDGTISFNIWSSMGTEYITSISYSTDNGTTWTTISNQNDKAENLSIDVEVETGNKVLWKGIATCFCTGNGDGADNSFFSATAAFNIYGNIMSLCYGDNFIEEKTLEYDNQFLCLFENPHEGEEESAPVVDASNLILSATVLTDYCYANMFYGCTSLTKAPVLPATTLADNCYDSMFRGCTSLTTAPELPDTTLAEECYYCMFEGCTSLTKAPVLPATTLTSNCYCGMFAGCTSLSYIKAMFTTTPTASYTDNWVQGVASTGTFVKNASATWTTTGVNGIPTGWTVETASA